MDQENDIKKLREFLNFFDKIINLNDIKSFRENISLLSSLENLFLKSHPKRRKEGTFYTSKKITKFMISEALFLLINEKLHSDIVNQKKVQTINDFTDLDLKIKQKIIDILLNITICDPACGSGNFLISSAEFLYSIIRKIDGLQDKIDLKSIILANLFGYDVNPYAIKLCQLKLLNWYCNNTIIDLSEPNQFINKNLKEKNPIFDSNFMHSDIIIGNPPYGNILSQNEKKVLKEQDIFYNDIYCTFLLKTLEWSKNLIGFLVPKSFLLRQSYIKFRDSFLSKANILKIYDLGSKMFKKATNEVQIIFYKKKEKNFSKNLEIYDFPNSLINIYKNQNVDSLRICFNEQCPFCFKFKKFYLNTFNEICPHCKSETFPLNRIRIKININNYPILTKIEKIADMNYLNPLDFPKIIRGEEDRGLQHIKEKLKNNSQGTCFFINAKNDFHYYYLEKNKSFNIEEIDSKVLKGKNYVYYLNPKLLIKHNNIIPEAIYTEDKICFTSSIYSVLNEDIDELKYLCAVINSSLVQFYCIYGINNQKDTTINLNQYMIRHLPIIKPNREIKSQIVENVDFIIQSLESKKGLINDKISNLLKEIDKIIFSLYEINNNEKSLIIKELKNKFTYFSNIYDKKFT